MKKKGSTYEGNWKDGFIDGKGKQKICLVPDQFSPDITFNI